MAGSSGISNCRPVLLNSAVANLPTDALCWLCARWAKELTWQRNRLHHPIRIQPASAGRCHRHRAGAQHRPLSRRRSADHIGRQQSIAAAQNAIRTEKPLGIVLQRDETVDEPTGLDLYRVGTVGSVLRYLTAPDGSHHVVTQGQQRFRMLEYLDGYPFLVARIQVVPEPEGSTPKSRRASSTCASRRSRRSNCCPRRRRNCLPLFRTSRPRRARRHGHQLYGPEAGREAGGSGDLRPDPPAGKGRRPAGPPAGSAAAVAPDQRADAR